MKKIVKALILAIAVIIIIALPVLAYSYSSAYTVSNNSSTAYTMLPVIGTVNNTALAANGFIQSDALDTRIETLAGSTKPHLVADNKTLTVIAVPATSNTNLYYTMGNSDLTSMPIITGYGGSVSVTDAAALEPSANYSFKWNGIRFSSWSANLTDKPNTFNIGYNPTTGNVTFTTTEVLTTYTEQDAGGFLAETGDNVTYTAMTSQTDTYLYKIYTVGYFDAFDIRWVQYANGDAVNPLGHAGIGVTNTLNDIAGLAATDLWATTQPWSNTEVEFRVGRGNFVSSNSTGLLLYANRTINHRLQRSAGSDIATYSIFTENMIPISSRTVSGLGTATYRYILVALNYNSGAAGNLATGSIANVRLNDPVLNVAVSSIADHDIDVTSNATTVGIQVDGGAWTTNATYTIPNTTSNWNFISNVPNVDNITMSVGGNPRLHYEPNTIIIGSTLPDRQTSDGTQDGTINWGSNPTDVDVVLGGMISSSQPDPSIVDDDDTRDTLPEVEVSDWFVEPDVSGTLLTNPLRPLVLIWSDNSTLTELQVWRFYGLIFVLFAAVATNKVVRGHLGIVSMVAGVAIGAVVAMTIWPFWSLVFALGAFFGGLILERTNSY